jgi:O-antigen/teichoic acid export membrane protein
MKAPSILKGPPTAIFLGMFVGGLGQLVMASGADHFLSDREFVSLITWNSFFGIVSLLIGSPLVGLIIVHASKPDHDLDVQKMQSSAISIGLIVSLLASAGWIIGGGTFADENRTLPILLLLVCPIYQVHSASQRGLLASEGKWGGVGFQLGLEGLLRGGLVIFLGLVGVKSSNLMILSSWVSCAISVELTYRFFPTKRAHSFPSKIRKEILRLFIPLWISSAAMHLVLTLTPNIMSLRTTDAISVGAISIGLFILRIPLTLSSTVFTPQIGPMAQSMDNGSAYLLFRKTLIFTVVFSLLTGLLSFIIGPSVMRVISDNNLLSNSTLIGMLGLSSGFFILAAALHTYLLARNLMRPITIGWAITAAIFLSLMLGIGTTTNSVAFVVLVSSVVASASLGLGAVQKIRVVED